MKYWLNFFLSWADALLEHSVPPGLCRQITGSFCIQNNGQYLVITVFACLAVTKTVLGTRTRKKNKKRKMRKESKEDEEEEEKEYSLIMPI